MNWKELSLGDIFNVGSSKRVLKSQWQTTGVPFYRGREVTRLAVHGKVDNELFISDEHFAELEKKHGVPKPDDIVITAIGTIGNSYVVKPGDRLYFKDASVLWLGKASDVDSEFVNYWLKSPRFNEQLDKGNGATVDTLTISKLKNAKLVIPPLPEQKRIVSILDEAFEGIDTVVSNTEKNLANVQELFDGYLSSIFAQRGDGWIDQPLKDVCIDYGRGKSKHRPRNDPRLYGGVYPFIQTGDVRKSSHVIKDYSATYNEAGIAQSKLWPEGTICITIAVNIAETGILGFDACFPDSIIGLVVDEKNASKEYVEYLLQSVKTVLKAKGKGSAQDNINLGTFENEKFPFPPLAKQEEIAANLHELSSTVSSLETIYKHKLSALAELKQSLLHKAFSGELTAREAEASVEEATA